MSNPNEENVIKIGSKPLEKYMLAAMIKFEKTDIIWLSATELKMPIAERIIKLLDTFGIRVTERVSIKLDDGMIVTRLRLLR